ncbi:MAG TPA: hypothetical protein VGD80_12525 [Kofleriaceae bacterium]
MTSLDNSYEIASGLAAIPIAELDLYQQMARLVPDTPWPAPVAPTFSAEALASLGAHILGNARRSDYAMVTRSIALHASLERWVETRSSKIVVVPDDTELAAWYRTRSNPPLAVCAAGAGFAWCDLVAVQQAGACVARLPCDSSPGAEAWRDAALERWRDPPRLPPRVWFIAPNNDAFTQRLARYIVPAAANALRECQIVCEERAASGDDVRLVVLLSHGDPEGAPVVPPPVLAAVLRACSQGAIVLHLGCHGAGRLAGERYGELAPRSLGVGGRAERDTCSPFARRCLDAGAPAVIAHLDATWSKTFERNSLRVLVEVIVLLATGGATAGYAALSLTRAADARARAAIEHLRANRVLEAGEAWLRYLDLSGFVCLGDVCALVPD